MIPVPPVPRSEENSDKVSRRVPVPSWQRLNLSVTSQRSIPSFEYCHDHVHKRVWVVPLRRSGERIRVPSRSRSDDDSSTVTTTFRWGFRSRLENTWGGFCYHHENDWIFPWHRRVRSGTVHLTAFRRHDNASHTSAVRSFLPEQNVSLSMNVNLISRVVNTIYTSPLNLFIISYSVVLTEPWRHRPCI